MKPESSRRGPAQVNSCWPLPVKRQWPVTSAGVPGVRGRAGRGVGFFQKFPLKLVWGGGKLRLKLGEDHPGLVFRRIDLTGVEGVENSLAMKRGHEVLGAYLLKRLPAVAFQLRQLSFC